MSTVVLDTITGKSTATNITIGSTPVVSASANSMTIRGEGSNQTSIQQGLVKAWFTTSVTPALTDSFNIASITDAGAGQLGVTVSTAFANTTYSATATGTGDSNINVKANWNETLTTTLTRFGALKTSNQTYTDEPMCGHFCGDLA